MQPPGAERAGGIKSEPACSLFLSTHSLVTLSLMAAGCIPLLSTILAAPCIVCAASSSASRRGRPIMTAPSTIASRKTHANAGPDPASAVHASKCFSGRKRHLPTEEKIERTIDESMAGASAGSGERMVIPSRIYSAEGGNVNV